MVGNKFVKQSIQSTCLDSHSSDQQSYKAKWGQMAVGQNQNALVDQE